MPARTGEFTASSPSAARSRRGAPPANGWHGRKRWPRTRSFPSPKQLAWFLNEPIESLHPHTTAAIGRIEQDPEAAWFSAPAQRFATQVRSYCVDSNRPADPDGELDVWLDVARLSDVLALETIATGLERVEKTARAGLTTSWGNDQAEGQISRLKLLKRTMYDRTGFPFLRRRIILTP
ncbi:transposase [Methylobacterium sp. SD274]|nr:transposase [Methylobacterium sp. SD274]